MTMLYQNLCYNEVCYKETALYNVIIVCYLCNMFVFQLKSLQ